MNLRNRFNLRSVVFGAMLALVTAACSNRSSGTGSVITGNHVTADQATTERQVGDSSTQFAVLGKSALMEAIASGRILASGSHAGSAALNKIATASTEGPSNEEPAEEPSVPTDPATAAPTLTVGYPIDLLGEYVVFGGVITKVSDTKSEDLGMLKLTDLTPIHARPSVARDSGGNFFLVLHGCVQACTETSTQLELLAIPVVGVDTKAGVIFLDLSVLGKEMNLVEMLDPNGLFTGLKTKTSVVSAIDFSVSTLVFDVEANMIPVQSDPADPDEKGTTFTTRWYLKLTSGFNPAFVARAATPGVGFFVTDRSAEPKIHRFSQYALGTGATAQPKVLYYIKDVPSQYRPAFAAAFDNWNEKFTDVIGRKLVEYEFVDATDPRHAHLVAGDIRYNIVEWDLVNNAPYGGLGPSIANQHTGEIFSANVLIQGPRVVEIYTKWFSDATTATNLRENGNVEEADSLLRQSSKELEKLAAVGKRKGKIDLTLGKHLQFRVTSQLPSLEDPVSAPR